MPTVQELVRSYSAADEGQIAFAWNGRHADELVDANMQFRRAVCTCFEEDKAAFPLPLIAALFKAETLFAKEAWGVNRIVSILAQEMLERGGAAYLDIYLAGARCGMDAFLETGNIALSKARCRELMVQCQANAAVDAGQKQQWAMLAERFSFLLTRE